MKIKRVFLIVLDSVGIGELPDAAAYGDAGSNTLAAISRSSKFSIPTLERLGLNQIDGVTLPERVERPEGSFARIRELSRGKDTTIGHWEISGVISTSPLPTYPDGFPAEVLQAFSQKTGRGWLCNKPYSGTEVLSDYGEEHMKTGKLIVYTSADSVFQIAAHEEIVPIDELYACCKMARELLQGEHGVGRVIARPFIGKPGVFSRTSRRHDFSLPPPSATMLDYLKSAGMDVIGVGKISDIFAGQGLTRSTGVNQNNADGMQKTFALQAEDFHGLCFVNLVDFDMLFGHRNDVDGYANALSEFDGHLAKFLTGMREDDLLLITADHGCDPSTASTDHSREHTPLIAYGASITPGINLATRESFADIAATVQESLGLPVQTAGESFWRQISTRV